MLDALLTLVRNELRRVWCYRWWVVAATLILWAGATAYVLRMPQVYTASGQIYVNPQTPLAAAAEGVSLVGENYGSPHVVRATLLNDENLEQIAKRLNPAAATDPGILEAEVNALRGGIRLAPDGGDGFVEVQVTDTDPVRARDTVAAVLDRFVSGAMDRNRSDLGRAGQFLDEQIAAYAGTLVESQERIRAFRLSHPEVVASTAAVGAPVEPLDLGPIGPSPAAQAAAARYAAASTRADEAESRLAGLLINLTEAHPDVVAARRQLGEARAALAALPVPPGARPARVRRAAARSAAPPVVAPEIAAAWADLQKQDEVIRRNYQELLSKRQATQISQAVYGSDVSKYMITQVPKVPAAPAGPDRRLFLLAAAVLAIGGGLGVGYLRAATKGVFVSPKELEDTLQLPVIGAVAWEPAWHTGQLRKRPALPLLTGRAPSLSRLRLAFRRGGH